MSENHDESAPRREHLREEKDARTGSSAAALRMQHQARWVDLQIQQAIERGEFDDLPGSGKPLGDLGSPEDRDWWLKKLIEREQITGVLPAALALRKEDAELDQELDRETAESEVRRILTDFNRRVVEARRQLQGGPPVVTPTRDLEEEVRRWRERMRARHLRPKSQVAQPAPPVRQRRRRRWFGRSADQSD